MTLVILTITIGIVSGSGWGVGGILGYNGDNASIMNSYSLYEVNGAISVGGIVGTHSGAEVRNAVALNPNVSGDEFNGRIMSTKWGSPLEGDVSNNHARNDMLINSEPFIGIGKLSNEHGASVAIGTIHTQAFWQTTMGWDFNNIWQWNASTKLPILRNVGGEQNHTLIGTGK